MSSKFRRIAISVWKDQNPDLRLLTNVFSAKNDKNFDYSDIYVYVDEKTKCDNVPEQFNIVKYDSSAIDNEAKLKNYINKTNKESGFTGFLHVIQHNIEMLKDPIEFMNSIEHMMSILDINSWLSTTTDVCNYLYKKYIPRLSIDIDDGLKDWRNVLNISTIKYCTNSNTQWMIFNIGKADDNELYFNESFTIAMFWIIEYLARRRNTHPNTLYFMNDYITCNEEYGVFKTKEINNSDSNFVDEHETMKKEGELFKNMNVDNHPDNNADEVCERTYLKLKEAYERLKSISQTTK